MRPTSCSELRGHLRSRLPLLGVTAGLLAGCLGPVPDDAADIELETGEIQLGNLETGYPAVGMVTATTGSCTGTLVTPMWVLTAAHCLGADMKFLTGSSSANFVTRAVQRYVRHPSRDLMLLQLSTPIEDIPVMTTASVTASLPLVGAVCTAVGFGKHTAGGTTTAGTKRSAKVRISSSSNSGIWVQMVDGLPDNGDSGGPLLCGNSIIEGAAKSKDPDVDWPNYTRVLYHTLDGGWLQRVTAPVFKELALQNGWTDLSYGTRRAGAALVNNSTVRLKGGIAGGTSGNAFVLPSEFRPEARVNVPVDLCNAKNGRLVIETSGQAIVTAEGSFADAQCFTSLDGVSYARNATAYTPLTLQNGWTNAPLSTSPAAVINYDDIVRLKGAIATTGASTAPFVLAPGFRPVGNVYAIVTLCNARKGRLAIQPNGVVNIYAESSFGDAKCTTSLEGVSFASHGRGFSGLALQNGWTSSGYGTDVPGVTMASGVVQFKGAIQNGTSGVAFTLPPAMRPMGNVYLPVDMYNAAKGRIAIDTNGVVSVGAANGAHATAQGFTSLDGVSFPISDFTPITLENGWKSYSSSTAKPAFTLTDGFVHLRGAISSGANAVVFRLPLDARPSGLAYVPVNLNGATKGRLAVNPNGDVTIEAEGGVFSNAQSFTSLDGVSFAVSTSGMTALALQNGWFNAPFSTRNAVVTKNAAGLVRLAGAIAVPAGAQNFNAFTLPVGFRPPVSVYLPVDMCNATKGRLHITSAGSVTLKAENDNENARCFTSLEGASFALTSTGYTALTLQNGWTNAPFTTRNAAAIDVAGVTRLQGAVATGTAATVFTLPAALRPKVNAYVSVDLCGGVKGRLNVSTSGVVTVQSGGTFGNAQCFTSLEGVFFPR